MKASAAIARFWLAAIFSLGLVGNSVAGDDNYLTDMDADMIMFRGMLSGNIDQDRFAEIEQQLSDALREPLKRNASGLVYVDYFEPVIWTQNCEYVAEMQSKGLRAGKSELKQCWTSARQKMRAWINAFPGSVLAVIGLSEIEVENAKWPATDEPNAYRFQKLQLEQASALLDRIPAEKRTVIWFTQRMRVATAQGWSAARFWTLLKAAAAKYPDHPRIYRQAVAHFLPSNGGDPQDIEKLARFAASAAPDDPGMYAQVYDQAISMQGGLAWNVYRDTPLQWKDLSAGFQTLTARFPSTFNLRRFASYACFAQDMSGAENLFDKLGSRWDSTDGGMGWTDATVPVSCKQQVLRFKAGKADIRRAPGSSI